MDTFEEGERGDPNDDSDDNGNFIRIIDYEDGSEGVYIHLLEIAEGLEVGDSVEAGQGLGKTDDTGETTDPHLHYTEYLVQDDRTTAHDPALLYSRCD